MTKPADREPLIPPKVIVAATRLGWFQQRAAHITIVLLTGALIAQGVERHIAVREAGTQVFVAITDPTATYTQIARAHREWQPEDGVYANTAMTWLRNVRARPLDPGQWVYQTTQVRATTDQALYGPVNQWMIQSRREHRNRAVEVEILEITIVGTPRPDGASVNIRWRERGRHQGSRPGDWVQYAGLITLVKIPPTNPKEVTLNPLGIRVLDYSFNPLVSARSDS